MKIPEKVKIGGLIYTIERTNNMCSDHCAEINYVQCTIKVRPDYNPQRTNRDFIHELVHAMWDNLGYTNQDEKQVDELAGALYSFLVDNPALFDGE